MRSRSLPVVAFCVFIALLTGCGLRNEWTEADKLFRAKKYAEAADGYASAAKQHPERRELEFNAACAQYAAGQLDEAIRRFQKLARETTGQLQQKSEYNTGNGYLQQGKADEALEHYKRALYLQPDDIDAKWNLELAQRRQQRQQQQQQQDKDDKKQQDKKDQQQEKNQQKDDQQGEQEQKPQQDEQDQQQGKDQGRDEQQRPQPTAGEMSKKDAERLLSGLSEEDKQLQKALRKPKEPTRSTPHGKDW
ncbi:MAG TPA: hypothetical protein DGT21_02985 [Armatimonadetes bacterium]|nr:hypothetical protein [Armatimonadota bacterium]